MLAVIVLSVVLALLASLALPDPQGAARRARPGRRGHGPVTPPPGRATLMSLQPAPDQLGLFMKPIFV